MKVFYKKKGFLFILAICISLSLVITFLYRKNELIFIKVTALVCRENTIKEQRDCFENKILARTRLHPEAIKPLFNSLGGQGTEGNPSYDMRLFSPIIHDVGMQLVERDVSLPEAISLCPYSFRGGCIHGVIMEYLDDSEHGDMSTWSKTICNPFMHNELVYKNCFHALGHEFMAKSNTSLKSTLDLCSTVPPLYKNNCLYGVFMEFSKGEAGLGRHSEAPVGTHDIPCDLVTSEYKTICLYSMGFYRQYEADAEPFETTYKRCNELPENSKHYCFDGIMGALLFSKAMNTQSAKSLCEELSPEFRNICLKNFY